MSDERVRKEDKSIGYQYAVDLTPSVLLVIFLSKVYRFDLETLLLLYDRIGEDLFFVFFLLAGRTVVMPKHTRLAKMFEFSNTACKAVLEGDEVVTSTKQEKEVVAFLESLYNAEERKVIIRTELPHVAYRKSGEDGEADFEPVGSPD